MVCRECGASHVCAPEKQKPKWKRILYEKQPYEDNHVDDSFLSSMVTNANVQAYDYLALSFDTLAIIQQVSAVVLFLIMFGHLWQGKLSAKYLVWVNVTLLFVGYATRVFLEEDVHMNQLMTLLQHISANIRQLFLFACILLGLSPVLKTLTFSFSSDTIYALTIVLYSMHLVLHDYSFVNLSNSKQVYLSIPLIIH